MEIIKVLDKGYVRLTPKGVFGSDLTVVNSARVSYNKEVEELSDKDTKLISFLAKHGHNSPFRHAMMRFEVYAPLMIARQWWKYVVGSDHTMDAWNESSRRYISEEPEFYIPAADQWRAAPANSKQGSGKPVDAEKGQYYTEQLMHLADLGQQLYEQGIEQGLAPEQCRLFLPAYSMYVRWYWTGSIESIAHLINQRVAHDSQAEFQEYARAVQYFAQQHFPKSIQELTGGSVNE